MVNEMRIKSIQFLILITVAVIGGWAIPSPVEAQVSQPLVVSLSADGPLTPAMVEYLNRGIQRAEANNAELVVFELNTPGGSIDLMNEIIQDIRASRTPVVVYISPRGAMAGSAGTLITLAAHASAMAPETTIGAASPVGSQGEDLGKTIESKEKNILKATVRSLAADRPENAISTAEEMIESAKAVSAKEALEIGLVDFIAVDLNDLLRQLNRYSVQLAEGERTLHTTNAEVVTIEPSFIEQILAILTNPNVVFLLMTIGVQAIIIEISSPGGWAAGFTGVVCLALAFYGLGVLDVNWFGIVFLLLAFILFILDIKAPTHGALTAAGVASLITGALVLFNSPNLPTFQPRISIPLVVLMSLATGGVFLAAMFFAVRAQKVPLRVGIESLQGRKGKALSDILPHGTGQVQLASELWTAELVEGQENVTAGDRIEVVRVEGVRLIVQKVDQEWLIGGNDANNT